MTRRERQLLEWIRENPCISQQELADKAGITRSSAAVHISNLMRKGYIAGRGYLLREAPYIAVVGGVNMDIGAVSDAPLVARDSNPGRVTTSLGGVGRNIAHNLCLLGEQVSMITVLGQDSFAQSVRENAADIGLDLSHSATIPGGSGLFTTKQCQRAEPRRRKSTPTTAGLMWMPSAVRPHRSDSRTRAGEWARGRRSR